MIPAYAPYQPPEQDISFPAGVADGNRSSRGSDLMRPSALSNEPGRANSMPKGSGFSFRGVSHGRILLTLNQMSVMTQNGIEIAEAVQCVAETCQDDRLAKSLHAIHEAVTSGQSLSSAIFSHGTLFPSTLAPMLAAAEASGEVPETLRLICTRMRGELQMRGVIIGALIYPVILVGASSVVMTALVLGVLPQFSGVFESMGKPVPVYTQLLLSFGDFCQTYFLGIIAAMIAAFFGVSALRHHPILQKPIARFLMYAPLIRDAYRPLQTGRALRTIAAMVQGGVPLLDAVRLSRQTMKDLYWRKLLTDIEDNLIDGRVASSALTNVDFIPVETAQLMVTAERTGRIAEVLEDVGAYFEEDAERRIKRLVLALEPAIIVVMGVIVAGIVMSVMLPLLDVSTVGTGS